MRNYSPRKWWSLLFVTLFAQVFAHAAWAQTYPSKPVHVIIGYPPGGGTDATARLLAQKLSESVGQPVVVENRPGASGLLATEKVAQSPPDGYSLVLIASSSILATALGPALAYDFERDLVPISLVTIQPFVLLVNPVLPVRSVRELIALAHTQPGKLNYGSAGVGGASHLAGELFNLLAKVKIVHVPYKGGGESVVAVAAGQIEISFASVTSALPLLTSGKLRALGVTTSKRTSLLPAGVPTLAESGVPGYDHVVWYAMLGRAGTSNDIVTRLNGLIGKIVSTPEMKEALNRQGLEPQSNSPQQLATMVRAEFVKNANLIKAANLKSE